MGTASPSLIGITTYHRNENNIFILPAKYVDSIRRAGGIGRSGETYPFPG
ncbi:MAG: hypothetical protein BroJett011_14660 [Chloroflexota bacterium]|nr:MAG: hypothetical protein BroJett011_14660 [Chloroflexota bacterium]